MASNPTADLPLTVSRERSDEAVCDALRLFVGRGRRYSVKQLSNATGVKDRVIECAMAPLSSADHRSLNLAQFLSVAKFLGAMFTSEVVRLCEQGAFDLPDDEPNPGNIAADVSEDAASVVRAVQSGTVSRLPEVGARMVRCGTQLVAMSVRAA